MKLTKLRAGAAVALSLIAAAPSRADLFAVVSPASGILRIDSATGAVTRTYPFPPFLPSNPAPTGLAFDGRVLYMTRPSNQLWQLDVVDNFWYPPAFTETFTNPTGQPQTLVGLGYRPNEFFGGSLIGVSRNPPDDPPSYIFQYFVAPGLPDPFLVNMNFPVGELPPAMAAQGADVDPATGDLWIAADEVVGSTRTSRLLRSDLTGAVLETLTPALDPPTLVRGLGFDAGAMFIAGRHLPTSTNNVYEIDRTTGAVVRSFALPGTGIAVGLAGGTVIPEPNGLLLAALALSLLTTHHRRRR